MKLRREDIEKDKKNVSKREEETSENGNWKKWFLAPVGAAALGLSVNCSDVNLYTQVPYVPGPDASIDGSVDGGQIEDTGPVDSSTTADSGVEVVDVPQAKEQAEENPIDPNFQEWTLTRKIVFTDE